MEWNELSMNQRAEVISMAVKAGLRDIDSIRSFYNGQSNSAKSHRFEGGGILSNAQLLDKVNALGHRAYIKNGQLVTSAGTPLVYNYNQDRFEFRNSAGRAYWLADNGQFKTYNKNHNIAATNLAENLRYPATYQTVLEDQAFVLNRSRIDDKKAVPYVEDKEHIIRRGLSKDVPISTNLIDTIKTNLLNNEHQKIALGISSRETNVGHYPSYYVKNPGNSGGISTFKLSGEVNPTDIMNNHQYYISPMRGELNAIYGVPNESPFVYGSPYAYYSMSHFLPFPDSKRKEIENNLKYQRKVGKFDPTKKRTGSNYYNPEDNPWKHAVEYFMDKNYGMGKSYIDKVNKEIPNINYLLNIDTTKNLGIGGYLFGEGGDSGNSENQPIYNGQLGEFVYYPQQKDYDNLARYKRKRERNIAKSYFTSIPTISNLYNAAKHFYKGTIGGESGNDLNPHVTNLEMPWYTQVSVSPKQILRGTELGNYVRKHIYDNVTPYAYSDPFKRGTTALKSIITRKQVDLDNPTWLKEYELSVETKARADAWRIYNGFPQKYNTFIPIKDRQRVYKPNMDHLHGQLGDIMLHDAMYLNKKGKYKDIVNGSGGNVSKYQIDINNNKGVLKYYDIWDLHPFEEGLISLTNSSPFTKKLSKSKIGKAYIKSLKDLEVGELTGGQPFRVETEIPFTIFNGGTDGSELFYKFGH